MILEDLAERYGEPEVLNMTNRKNNKIMKTMKKIKERLTGMFRGVQLFFRERLERRALRIRSVRYSRLLSESHAVLQVREWNGMLFICYMDTPLMSGDDVSTLTKALDTMRTNWLAYELERVECSPKRTD